MSDFNSMTESFKTPGQSATTITELMIPSYANFGGKVHGGILLSLMDKVAYACASKHSGAYCVTVAVDGVEFLSPVEVGELVSLTASVHFVGNTTMIVGIQVESLQPRTGIVKHTNSCYFTMAAKDENGKLIQVPGLKIENREDLIQFCEGKSIRENSKINRALLENDMQHMSLDEQIQFCDQERCIIQLNR
jgi:uncharacterized protein (TIGR00369 family)